MTAHPTAYLPTQQGGADRDDLEAQHNTLSVVNTPVQLYGHGWAESLEAKQLSLGNDEKFIAFDQQHNDKYMVEEVETPDTYKETAKESPDDGKKRGNISKAQIWAIIIVILVIVAGAIGGGIGKALSKKKKGNSSTNSSSSNGGTAAAAQRTTMTSATPTLTTASTTTRKSKTTSSSSPTPTACVAQNATYTTAALTATAQGDPITTLPCNVRFVFQNDNNFVVYNDSDTQNMKALWKTNHTASDCSSNCQLTFGNDGNLVNEVDGTEVWDVGTAGKGENLVFMNEAPWVVVLGSGGEEMWRSWDGVV
ncbi:hypothetical protein B0J12DRAFT_83997 [Macrophomina phaseolina]|uniref:Bulb-type lectin domain-containing protein n=1 Tax=Macrophomina phaseolina TaxID=35725 RepID=A0ABQ8GCM3_9PEZI|nr:hypothetical protein B0J12DRAFT_83997 [Macrophomina phaseolina]